MDIELENALEAVEANLGIGIGELRVAGMPPYARFSRVLKAIRECVCPKSEDILAAITSDEVSLSSVICDVLLSSVSGIPAPCATISQHIARIGLKRFCLYPESLITLGDRQIDEQDLVFAEFAVEHGTPAGETFTEHDPIVVSRMCGVSVAHSMCQLPPPTDLVSIALRESYVTHRDADFAIETGVILGLSPNAVVAKRGGRYVAAIISPMPLLISNIVNAFCSHPEFFPSIGTFEPAKCFFSEDVIMPGLRALRRSRYAVERIHTAVEFKDYLESASEEEERVLQSIDSFDAARWNLRAMFGTLCLNMLWQHEMAHIMSGHIDYLESVQGMGTVSEASGKLAAPEQENRLRQFMEFEADMRASRQVLLEAISASCSPSFFERNKISPQDHCMIACIAALTVSLTLSVTRYASNIDATKRYPSDPIRAQAIELGLLSTLNDLDRSSTFDNDTSKEIRNHFTKNYYSTLVQFTKIHKDIASWTSRLVRADGEANTYVSDLYSELDSEIATMNKFAKYTYTRR